MTVDWDLGSRGIIWEIISPATFTLRGASLQWKLFDGSEITGSEINQTDGIFHASTLTMNEISSANMNASEVQIATPI